MLAGQKIALAKHSTLYLYYETMKNTFYKTQFCSFAIYMNVKQCLKRVAKYLYFTRLIWALLSGMTFYCELIESAVCNAKEVIDFRHTHLYYGKLKCKHRYNTSINH